MSRSFLMRAFASLFLCAAVTPWVLGQNPAGWGNVKGQITWGGGAVPPPAVVQAVAIPPACLKNGPIPKEDLVINPKNKGIRWTFVWLTPMNVKAKMPVHPDLKAIKVKQLSFDQPCCKFEPHAIAMREGQELVAKNGAQMPHNVKWQGFPTKNPGGNQILPAGGSFTITDLKADRFPVMIECNIHPWMKAVVRVFDHPYFALTDENGKFEIKQAPAGQYRLFVWQEAIGWWNGVKGKDGKMIEIKPNADTEVNLEMKK